MWKSRYRVITHTHTRVPRADILLDVWIRVFTDEPTKYAVKTFCAPLCVTRVRDGVACGSGLELCGRCAAARMGMDAKRWVEATSINSSDRVRAVICWPACTEHNIGKAYVRRKRKKGFSEMNFQSVTCVRCQTILRG